MKLIRLFHIVTLMAMAIFLASCTYYLPRTNSSGSLLQASLPPEKYTIMGAAEGTSCASFILQLPIIGTKNTFQAAVNNAIRSKGGDLFIQATSDESFFFFPHPVYGYSERCVTVQGLVIKLK